MAAKGRTAKLTAGERAMARLLRAAPWLAFFVVAFPVPLYFLWQYFGADAEAAVYMLLTLVSLAAGSFVGLLAIIFLILYRRRWERSLRTRLAADGVTADELSWFMSELKPAERRALKEAEANSPLLADAYRETLAARVTAARVLSNARREMVAVERRLGRASTSKGSQRAALEQELRSDRERLSRVIRETTEHNDEIETRLQMIEALSGRGASEAETERALLQLGATREMQPLSLTAAQLEREAREQAKRELEEQTRKELGEPNRPAG
ncbi:MAG TPA: hypothetical protein VER32_12415 [Pyrinomonadaceae bacterium]|nr:hypothetical protein [Pyrinomonadaceae bacterium]